jgi:formate/nitrite transporter FocA (FNT family)
MSVLLLTLYLLIHLSGLFKNWFFTYAGNFVGSVLMAYLVFKGCTLGNGLGILSKANYTISQSFEILFIRGILCNWLVCMAVYMASGKIYTYILIYTNMIFAFIKYMLMYDVH